MQRPLPLVFTLLLLLLATAIYCPAAVSAQPPNAKVRAVTPPIYSKIWQDQIVYVLIAGKFYDCDLRNDVMKKAYHLPNPAYQGGFLGGDIAGILQKMSYLKWLGISSVLLYPLFRNDTRPIASKTGSYLATGYRVRDYQTIDPNFGTNQDFRQMVAEFHRGTARIRVIVDLPIAMTGLEHPWYVHASDYPGYYRPWNTADKAENTGAHPLSLPYGLVDSDWGIPIVNHTLGMNTGTGVYGALRDKVVFWLTDTFDIDCLRYDSAQDFHADFWKTLLGQFRSRYARTKPDFMQLGEVVIWPRPKSWQVPAQDYVNAHVTTDVGPIRMDGIYDFSVISAIQNVFARGQPVNLVADALDQQAGYYEHPEKLIASLDSYEDPTFLQRVTGGHARQKIALAAAFLLTINRVPFIYSGNEFGMDYTQPGALFAGGLDRSYHARFTQLIRIRRDNVVFRRGSLQWLHRTGSLLAYARVYQRRSFIVVLNNSAMPQTITLDLGSEGIYCRRIENLFRAHDPQVQLHQPGMRGSSLSVTLQAWEAKIIRCR